MLSFYKGEKINLNIVTQGLIFLLVLFFLLTPSASARDYSLEEATANITVDSNGLTHVEESISYNFEGTYFEVFRRIYYPPGGSIENIQGYCNNEQCTFEIVSIQNGYELIGKLPQPTPEKITFVVSYDYHGGVKVYNDISELHYKLWGDEWERPLNTFTATLTLPTETGEDISYWLHPNDYTQQTYLEDNVIRVKADNIPSNSWYEIRAVFPRIESPDSKFVSIQNEDGFEEILAVEKEYESKQNTAQFLFILTILFVSGIFIFPFYIYFKYGKEPRVDYYALYEREPPTDSKPAVVNALLEGQIGIPTLEGFTGTVMDLVNRDYVSLRDKHETEDVIIEINEKTNLENLLDFEIDVYNLLKSHAPSGSVLWSQLKADLGRGTEFYKFVNEWNKKVKNQIKVDKLFVSKGNSYMVVFSITTIIAAFLAFWLIFDCFPLNQFPVMTNVKYLVMIAAVFSVGLIIFTVTREKSFGRWTSEGRLFQKTME